MVENTEAESPRRKVRARLVPRAGEGLRVIRLGQKLSRFDDLYVELLSMPWIKLSFIIWALYFVSNLLFALVYFYSGGVDNARAGSFQDFFFFSVQTMATIGYGKMFPTTFLTNVMVSIEALWGFSFFAVTTALLFAKFSQPTARVTFSDVAVIGIENGKPFLMLRLANERNNRIVNAKIELVLLRNDHTQEGRRYRRFYDLELVRNHVPLLQLTWTVMHPLNEKSPLYGITQEKLDEMEAEIIVSLSGMDETLHQTIHTRHSYIADEIICNAMFEDVLNRRDDGFVEVNYGRIHTIRHLEDKLDH